MSLPLEHIREYDGAAEHYARKGKLPENMGRPGALDYINKDPESFLDRVREFRYAIAMEKGGPICPDHALNILGDKP